MVVLPPMPARIARLPRDERGYPIPWFVATVNGQAEFRLASAAKFREAIQQRVCWVCGMWLYKERTFVVGPMSAISRTHGEPPCHAECAEFSVRACPFLTRPAAIRREANLPADTFSAGNALDRNPGCSALWDCHSRPYQKFPDGRGGILFRLPDPDRVTWWSEGRAATREEVLESMRSGTALYLAQSGEEPTIAARKEWKQLRQAAMQYVPA